MGPNKIGLYRDVQENLESFKARLLGLVMRDRKMKRIPKKRLTDLLQEGDFKHAEEIDCEQFIETVRGMQTTQLDPPNQELKEGQAETDQDIITVDWYPIVSSQSSPDSYFPRFGQ